MSISNKKQKIQELINKGVIFIDPDNVYVDETSLIEPNTIIHPGVIINNNVHIKENCIIYAYSNITNNVTIFNNVSIGQYSLIRDNTQIGAYSSIGPHCELTRSILGCNCLIGHKNFIADAVLMDDVKFGASVIIANSNWQQKFKTFIGAKTKIGVNVVLIAPINIGNNCFISPGIILKNNLEDNKFIKQTIEYIIKDNKLK